MAEFRNTIFDPRFKMTSTTYRNLVMESITKGKRPDGKEGMTRPDIRKWVSDPKNCDHSNTPRWPRSSKCMHCWQAAAAKNSWRINKAINDLERDGDIEKIPGRHRWKLAPPRKKPPKSAMKRPGRQKKTKKSKTRRSRLGPPPSTAPPPPPKKSPTRRSPTKKSTTKKSTTKKKQHTAKKAAHFTPIKKSTTKKSPTKKLPTRRSTRRRRGRLDYYMKGG